ncbi:hypothetical protein MLD38_021749 [Melastoma candidum]|uniref:Uncharacterized protein n=1 Tax=Melastoma candidum TaxID=119954 RepID=A0ACB9QH57_9MYRT|nr:hypothetical protein MLD38_021749 [Melastoma candidum]
MGNPHGKWPSKASKLETTIWAIRILLICLGLGSCFALLKAAVIPYASSFVVDTIPCIWNSGRVLFSPPYIYIIVNCIIIAIAASNSFHHQNNLCRKADMTPPSLYSQRSQVGEMQFADKGGGNLEETAEVIKQMISDSGISPNTSEARIGCNSSILPDNPSNTSGATLLGRTMAEESFEMFPEKEDEKLPETSAAGVEEGDNTLDSIWTEITEGRGQQPRPQLKKSDTWDTATRQALNEAEPGEGGGGKTFTKSETFRERTTAATAIVEGIVEKEKSMGQDELKLRIEAFIRKNHDYLRLQREESHVRFVETVNSGIIRG